MRNKPNGKNGNGNGNGKRRLTDGQMKIARAAPPRDQITGQDFSVLRAKKNRVNV
jgi:hypothetical protein